MVAEGMGFSVADVVEPIGLSHEFVRIKDPLIVLCMADQIRIAMAKVMMIVSPMNFLGIYSSVWMICSLVSPNHSMS